MRRTLLAVLVLSTLARGVAAQAVPAPAAAPAANRTGFFVGFDPLAYATLSSGALTGGRTKGGSGVALRFGWGFSKRVALVMDVPVTDLPVSDTTNFLLSHGDIALMFFPVTWELAGRPLIPFGQVGAGLRALDATLYDGGSPQTYAFAGEVFSLGAGARLYIAPQFAIALHGWWSIGEFNDVRVGNVTTHNQHISATSARVQTGLEWHLGRKAQRPK
jgi:hypothetical protein